MFPFRSFIMFRRNVSRRRIEFCENPVDGLFRQIYDMQMSIGEEEPA